jgi:predicted dehydrogenase/nucleoside-diphosphate-sugar epimerase
MSQPHPKFLFLGGGPVVSELYLPALARLGWRDGHLACDKFAANLARIRAMHPGTETFAGGYEEVLARSETKDGREAAVVALPNFLHAAAVERALETGWAVLCEKPLALTEAECLRLGQIAKAAGRPLAVGMVRRHIPAVQAARAVLRKGKLGALRRVTVEHGGPYAWTSDSGEFFRRENGGILADLGVHYLDWLADLLGPLQPVAYTDDAQGGVEASCDYLLKTGSGVPVRLRLTHLKPRADTICFEGEHGSLILDRNDFARCRLSGLLPGLANEIHPERPFAREEWPSDLISCFAQQLLEFAETLRGGAVAVTAEKAAETIGLIEHAYRERRTHTPQSSGGPTLVAGRTVVTGGTGFIGGALVERLTALGFREVTVPVRSYRTCANVARFGVSLPKVDLLKRAQVREMVAGARWVFHLAYGQAEHDARRVTVEATRILVEEAEKAGVEAVVVLSSMAVFGKPESAEPVDETWARNPAYGTYGKTKAEMETWCLARKSPAGGTRVIVLNPTCVFGPGGKTYTQLPRQMSREGRFAWIEGGRGVANLVYIDNLVDAMLLAAGSVAAGGQQYLVNDTTVTWREFLGGVCGTQAETWPDLSAAVLRAGAGARAPRSTLGQIARHLLNDYGLLELINRHPVLSRCKAAVLRIRRAAFEKARQALPAPAANGKGRPEPPAWLADLFGPETTRFSSRKLRDLGWKPRVDFAEGLRRTREWADDEPNEKAV